MNGPNKNSVYLSKWDEELERRLKKSNINLFKLGSVTYCIGATIALNILYSEVDFHLLLIVWSPGVLIAAVLYLQKHTNWSHLTVAYWIWIFIITSTSLIAAYISPQNTHLGVMVNIPVFLTLSLVCFWDPRNTFVMMIFAIFINIAPVLIFSFEHVNRFIPTWLMVLPVFIGCYIMSKYKFIPYKENFFIILELRDANEKLTQYSDELKNLNSEKDFLLSVIAHDLKNPFTIVIAFAELALEELKNNSLKVIEEYVQTIDSAAQDACNLLEDLLEWSLIKTDKIEYASKAVNIQNLIAGSTGVTRAHAKKKGIHLVTDISTDCQAKGDQLMLETVMRNLISNAIKFSHKNSEIYITARDTGDELEIAIKDSGTGIENENIQKILQDKIYFSSMGTEKEKGTGLGLKLCLELIKKNNGKLSIESEPGKGSIFKFTLPKY